MRPVVEAKRFPEVSPAFRTAERTDAPNQHAAMPEMKDENAAFWISKLKAAA